MAPSFQAAKAAIISSGEFGNPRASRSPKPRPRAANAPASWLDRRSSSAVVSDPFGAIQCGVGVDRGLGLHGRQLPEPLDEADRLFFHDLPCDYDDDPVSMAPRRRTASRT